MKHIFLSVCLAVVVSPLAVSCAPGVPGSVATAPPSPKPATSASPTASLPTDTSTPTPSLTETRPTPSATPSATPQPTPTVTSPSPTEAPTLAPTPTLMPISSLRGYAQGCGMQIGAAVAIGPLRNEPVYAETLAREFSILTPENRMKFDALHPGRDRYDFADADFIVDFAERNGMQVRGHTLVWHNQLPGWLTGGHWTREDLIVILHDHVQTVVGHYRGRVAAWDVVNEAVADGVSDGDVGQLRDTIWLRGIGPEYIEMAFHWAHEADPAARLFYNDYGGEGLCPKSDAIYDLVRRMVQRGVPIHGVGLQMHVSLSDCVRAADVAANIERLAALGLEVHVTEMDVRIEEPVTQEKLDAQARIYRDLLRVCLEATNCRAFVLWGFADCHSWIPDFFPGCGAGLIFDEQYQPKPAREALQDVLVNP